MTAELDHVFVCCAVGAPEAALLARRGLREGSSNTHAGQGTANRRFFFSNAYLELLWVNDPAEAQSEDVLPTQLWERWSHRNQGACPFGIVFRPRTDLSVETPFPSWSYRPPYLPSGLSIEVGREMAMSEPQLFYLPFARNRDPSGREPTIHPAGIDRVTHVSVTIPHGREPSPTLAQALVAGLLTLGRGPEHLLMLTYEGAGRSSLDLRPGLPLEFSPCGTER
jgi:Glyoxalase-like domain